MFEEIVLQNTFPTGNAEEKVPQIIGKFQRAFDASMTFWIVPKKRMPNF